jgi:transposase
VTISDADQTRPLRRGYRPALFTLDYR